MPLRAIAYVSDAVTELPAARLEALVDDAHRFNRLAGVTGVLLFDGARFLQFLEGPADGLEAVYERIVQARSHRGMVELMRGRFDHRHFPYWAMRRLSVDRELMDSLLAGDWEDFVRRSRADGSQGSALVLLEELVQPLVHAG